MLGNDYFKAEDPDSTYIFKSKLGVNLFQPINPKRSPEKYKKMKKGHQIYLKIMLYLNHYQ